MADIYLEDFNTCNGTQEEEIEALKLVFRLDGSNGSSSLEKPNN
jgi:hypothetical protein